MAMGLPSIWAGCMSRERQGFKNNVGGVQQVLDFFLRQGRERERERGIIMGSNILLCPMQIKDLKSEEEAASALIIILNWKKHPVP